MDITNEVLNIIGSMNCTIDTREKLPGIIRRHKSRLEQLIQGNIALDLVTGIKYKVRNVYLVNSEYVIDGTLRIFCSTLDGKEEVYIDDITKRPTCTDKIIPLEDVRFINYNEAKVDIRKMFNDDTLTDEQCNRIELNLCKLSKALEQRNTGSPVGESPAPTADTPVDTGRNRAEIAYRLLERGILRALQNNTSDIDELKSNLRTCLDDTYNQYMKAMADNSSWWL